MQPECVKHHDCTFDRMEKSKVNNWKVWKGEECKAARSPKWVISELLLQLEGQKYVYIESNTCVLLNIHYLNKLMVYSSSLEE